jgi:type IV pilus assembly protein PilA
MNKNKKGFTLVELLAVIVILAIILAIAIPSITGLIDSQRKSAFESNVKMIIKGIEYEMLENPGTVYEGDNYNNLATFGADPAQYDSFTIDDLDPVTVSIVANKDGKFAGYCTKDATYNSVDVDDQDCEVD